MVIDHKAFEVHHFKASLATLRPPNANVHHALRIQASIESRHVTKKMTGPSLRS
jgi:hypothetical protein